MSDHDYNKHTQYTDQQLPDDEYSIRELIDVIFSRIKMILLITFFAGLLSFAVSQYLITPYYEASVKLFVNNSRVGQTDITNINDLNASARLVNTYMEIVKSNTVLDKIAEKNSGGYTAEELKKMVTTKSVQNTEIFYVTVRSTSAGDARILANQIAVQAPLGIMEFVEATSVKVIEYATLPREPASPNVMLNTAIGLMLGLILSVLLALLLDMLDVTIRSEDDIKSIVDLPVLGVIPTIDMADSKMSGYGKKKNYRSKYEY
jgi:capsular polysaccharide biosynthesis protein